MKLIPLFFATLLFWSCNEYAKEATDIALFITPKASEKVRLNSGEKICYTIELHTTHNYISRLQLSSFDAQYGSQLLKDTLFDKMQNTYQYEYTAPMFRNDSARVELLFKGWDDAGSTREVTRSIEVISRQVLSDELTGIVLTEDDNAIEFAYPSQPFNYSESSDSTVKADLYITTEESFANITVRTSTAAKFVRNNSFDYATATSTSIQTVYESSRRSDFVNDLRVNDIIIVGHGTVAEGVFSVTNIVREGKAGECSVRLSFKKVSSRQAS